MTSQGFKNSEKLNLHFVPNNVMKQKNAILNTQFNEI
jgi:hypothetical protein